MFYFPFKQINDDDDDDDDDDVASTLGLYMTACHACISLLTSS